MLEVYQKYLASKERYKQYLQTEEGKEYNRLHSKAFYERNKETISEKRHAFYEANKEKLQEKRREYYHQNREKILEKARQKKEEKKAREQLLIASVLPNS